MRPSSHRRSPEPTSDPASRVPAALSRDRAANGTRSRILLRTHAGIRASLQSPGSTE